jgi:hypothetical protein
MKMSILVRAIERQIDNERRAFAKSRDACADAAHRVCQASYQV